MGPSRHARLPVRRPHHPRPTQHRNRALRTCVFRTAAVGCCAAHPEAVVGAGRQVDFSFSDASSFQRLTAETSRKKKATSPPRSSRQATLPTCTPRGATSPPRSSTESHAVRCACHCSGRKATTPPRRRQPLYTPLKANPAAVNRYSRPGAQPGRSPVGAPSLPPRPCLQLHSLRGSGVTQVCG